MSDRVIRDELLESSRWLGLRGNAERLAFIALILTADDYGNAEGGPARLHRLWRDFGCRTLATAEDWLGALVAADLVRVYHNDGKRFIHLPRFHQRLRFWKRAHPLSPWNEPDSRRTKDGLESGKELRSEENPPLPPQRGDARHEAALTPNNSPHPAPVVDESPHKPVRDWWLSEEAMNRKGEELGKPPRRGESKAEYLARLREAVAHKRLKP